MSELIEKVERKKGFFELNFDDYQTLKKLISPESGNLQSLMTELRYNNESREFINLPHIGPIDVPKPIIPDDIIFRGQADSNWALTPSLFRSAKLHHISSPQGLVEREYENLIKFQKFCDRAGVQIPGDSFSRRQLQ